MSSPFPKNSRYAQVPTTQLVRADGTAISFLKRRIVPDPSRFTTIVTHSVSSGERLDNITAAYIDDPELFWRICDANRTIRPADLTGELGDTIDITLPEGVAGPSRA